MSYRNQPVSRECAFCGERFEQRHHETKFCSMACTLRGRVRLSGDCWLWAGTVARDGYGMVCLSRSRPNVLAHRVSYETFVGAIPPGQVICHRCDTPRCINPAHLFVGTHRDNAQDSVRKGRRARMRGEQSPVSKLTETDVRRIRARPVAERDALAREYGVTWQTIWNIQKGRTWRHLANE